MKKATISIVAFILGAAAGGAASYIYTKKKYEKISEDEVKSVKSYYKEMYASKLNQASKLGVKLDSYREEDRAKMSDIPETDTNESEDKELKKEYTNYAAMYEGKEEVEEVKEKPKAKPSNKRGNLKRIISEKDFDADSESDKFVLTYYELDNVLADGDEVVDITEMVGGEAIRMLINGREDSVYVKNEKLDALFQVVLDKSSFDATFEKGR